MIKLRLNGPANLFKTLHDIQSQKPDAKIVLNVHSNEFYDVREALGYYDVIKYFTKESGKRLNIELWMMQYTSQILLFVAAAIDKDKLYFSPSAVISFTETDGWYHGTMEEMKNMKKANDDVTINSNRILHDAFDIDADTHNDLIESNTMWEQEDIDLLGFKNVKDSPNYGVAQEQLVPKPSPIIVLGSGVGSRSAEKIIEEIQHHELLLNGDANVADRKMIMVLVETYGGSVLACLTILDAFERCSFDIATMSIGYSMSAGGVTLAAGNKGDRLSMPNSQIMIHQARGWTNTNGLDTYERLNDRLTAYLSDFTGQPLEKMIEILKEDSFYSAEEAMNLGLIDAIVDTT